MCPARAARLAVPRWHYRAERRPPRQTGMACSSRASAFAGAQVAFVPPTRRCGAAPGVLVVECAHKKGAGSVKNGQDSEAKRLGVKIYGDQPAFSGNIILRQRGTVVRRGGVASPATTRWPSRGGNARCRDAAALDTRNVGRSTTPGAPAWRGASVDARLAGFFLARGYNPTPSSPLPCRRSLPLRRCLAVDAGAGHHDGQGPHHLCCGGRPREV
jgi:hypothetical protein